MSRIVRLWRKDRLSAHWLSKWLLGIFPGFENKTMESHMIKALSRTSIVWDAALLGAAILITIVAGAYHLTEAATLGAGAPLARYHVADELDANPGDGSIIIECMALGDRASAEAGEAR